LKSRTLIILVLTTIAAIAIVFFAFETTAAEILCVEQGGVVSGDLCIMENPSPKLSEDSEINELSPDKISFMEPNSMVFFFYPNPEDTENREEFQRFILIRLPEYLGGAVNDVSAFRAYSAISISTDHCITKYWPEQGRQRMEDPCWGTMYRAIDGLIIQNTDPVLITSPMALPHLDLSTDDNGSLYVEPPVWTSDENGVVGFGRSMSMQEVRQGSQIIADSYEKLNPNRPPIPVEFGGFLLADVNPYNSRTEARYYDFSSMGHNYIHLTTNNVSAQDQKYFLNFAKPNTEFWQIGDTVIQIGSSAFDPNNNLPERYQEYNIQFILDGFKFSISGNNLEVLKKSTVSYFFPEFSYEELFLISSTVEK
jgi:ubiquinol-cytochrome c reductase iron-sulfur subunit